MYSEKKSIFKRIWDVITNRFSVIGIGGLALLVTAYAIMVRMKILPGIVEAAKTARKTIASAIGALTGVTDIKEAIELRSEAKAGEAEAFAGLQKAQNAMIGKSKGIWELLKQTALDHDIGEAPDWAKQAIESGSLGVCLAVRTRLGAYALIPDVFWFCTQCNIDPYNPGLIKLAIYYIITSKNKLNTTEEELKHAELYSKHLISEYQKAKDIAFNDGYPAVVKRILETSPVGFEVKNLMFLSYAEKKTKMQYRPVVSGLLDTELGKDYLVPVVNSDVSLKTPDDRAYQFASTFALTPVSKADPAALERYTKARGSEPFDFDIDESHYYDYPEFQVNGIILDGTDTNLLPQISKRLRFPEVEEEKDFDIMIDKELL